MSDETYTREEVAKHNTEEDLWMIIDHKVYDLTDFVDGHPGGNVVLAQVAGQDATKAFYNLHRQEVLDKYESSFRIGTIKGEKPEVIVQNPGDLCPVPYAEPLWLRPQFRSPYFTDKHRELQKRMRKFIDTYTTPEATQKEEDGTYISQELIDRMAQENIIGTRLGPGKHLNGQTILGFLKGEEFDYFSDMVMSQEGARSNARGFQDGNLAGLTISLPAIRNYLADDELRERIIKECMTGQKKSCLAITEAFAGSDVAGLRTTSELTPDGKHYIINGTKKWITNGTFSDYFVTACKSDKGFNMILVPRQEGVTTTAIKTSYSPTAGTAYVQFDNVKVPVNHLLGKEHMGFMVIMANFNHERFMMICGTVRKCRTIVEECLKWSNQRIIFGKRLIDQPAIRLKLAKMISIVEANQAWLEQITYQLNSLPHSQHDKLLGGPIALLKAHATRGAHDIADEAVQIFGGRALTKTGMGKVVEGFQRTYKFDAILGGSEEILADLGVRQALKFMPKSML